MLLNSRSSTDSRARQHPGINPSVVYYAKHDKVIDALLAADVAGVNLARRYNDS